MLEEELVLEGVASETLRCLSSGFLKASPAPLSTPLQQKHLGYLDQGGPGKESPPFRLPAAPWSRGDGPTCRGLSRSCYPDDLF